MSTIFRNDQPEPVVIDEVPETAEAPVVEPVAKVPGTDRHKQIALFTFVGVFIAVIGSSVLYLASRRADATANAAPPPAAPVAAVVQQQLPPAVATAPPEPKVASVSVPPVIPNHAAAVNAPPPSKVASPASAPAPSISNSANPAPVVSPLTPGMEKPVANKTYLQIGSLEKGVAELLAQGLRLRGVPATIAPGVTAIVSRIIVGPFETNDQMTTVNKQLNDLGFKPFPRRFEPEELRKLLGETASIAPPAGR